MASCLQRVSDAKQGAKTPSDPLVRWGFLLPNQPCPLLPLDPVPIQVVACWCVMARAAVPSIRVTCGPSRSMQPSGARVAGCKSNGLRCSSVSHCVLNVKGKGACRLPRYAITSSRWLKAGRMTAAMSRACVMHAMTSSLQQSRCEEGNGIGRSEGEGRVKSLQLSRWKPIA